MQSQTEQRPHLWLSLTGVLALFPIILTTLALAFAILACLKGVHFLLNELELLSSKLHQLKLHFREQNRPQEYTKTYSLPSQSWVTTQAPPKQAEILFLPLPVNSATTKY